MLSRKIMENRISVKDFAMEMNITEAIEAYVFECGHTEYEEFDLDFAHHHTIDEFDSFEINENNELVLIRHTSGLCEECEWKQGMKGMGQKLEQVIYCEDMPRPEGFDNVVKYHGLAAYSGTKEATGAEENAIAIQENPEWQICCSTRPIGPIGLVIEGTTITASNVDLYTRVDLENGKRYFVITDDKHDRACRGIIHSASQLEKKWDHDEIVTQNNSIARVWIKDWAIEDFGDLANELCEIFNVKLEMIETEEEYDDGL